MKKVFGFVCVLTVLICLAWIRGTQNSASVVQMNKKNKDYLLRLARPRYKQHHTHNLIKQFGTSTKTTSAHTNYTLSETSSNIDTTTKTSTNFVQTSVRGMRSFALGELLQNLQKCEFRDQMRDDDFVRIPEGTITFLEYKVKQAQDFVEEKANPFKKCPRPPTLRTFQFNGLKHNPNNIVHRRDEVIDDDVIKEYFIKEKARRSSLGDLDVTLIPEVADEMSRDRIPNIAHFIYFGCLKARIFEYQALVGVLRYQKPRLILFHTDCEPHGEFWDAFKVIAGTTLKVVQRSPPEAIWGRKIGVVEHKADVARLEIMLEVGGVYLDTDSVVTRSMDELMTNSIVLGEESNMDLANGVILARRDSWFLKRWFWEYKYFNDGQWGHNSVVVPWGLWKLFPDKITVVKQKICRPNWLELNMLYHELIEWKDHFVVHLYSRFMKQYDGVSERALKDLAVLNTTYGEAARHVIWGDSRIRDVTQWVVTCNVTQRLIREYDESATPGGL